VFLNQSIKGLFFFATICVWASPSVETDNFSEAKRNSEVEALSKAPEWVGAFYARRSCDEGVFVYTSTKSGFAFHRRSISGYSDGKVIPVLYENGELRAATSHEELDCPQTQKPFVLVRVDDYVFLIPSGQVHGFCINVRQGRGMRLDKYFHTYREPNFFVLDLPKSPTVVLPEAYKHLLELPSLSLPVTKVRQSEKYDTVTLEARIDNANNVYEGMELSCLGSIFEVREINSDSVVVVCTHNLHGVSEEELKESILVTSR
jgi:hypothetical protein